MRGRKPKPTALKLSEGNPGRRPLPKDEPAPEVKIPEPPGFLDVVARVEWLRIAPILLKNKIITELDGIALALYCRAFSQFVKADGEVQKFGEIIRGPAGGTMRNPWMEVANRAWEQVTKMLASFGMDPVSRTRVHSTGKSKEEESLDDFVKSKPVPRLKVVNGD